MRRPGYFNRSFFYALVLNIFDRLFISYWLCWFFIRFSRGMQYYTGWLNNWLTDFVFVPLVVHFSLVIGNTLLVSNDLRKYSLLQILGFSLCTSIVFEGLLPRITSYNVGDWGDVLAYFSGGIFYYYVHQNMSVKNMEIRHI